MIGGRRDGYYNAGEDAVRLMSLSDYALADGGAAPPPVLSESYPAIAESIPRARGALAQFAAASGAGQERLDAVRLALSEAMTNAVVHAYRGNPGRVYLTAWLVADELWVLIADEGSGLRATSRHRGLGIGLGLIQQVSDQLAIVERAGGGTEVRLCFAIVPD